MLQWDIIILTDSEKVENNISKIIETFKPKI